MHKLSKKLINDFNNTAKKMNYKEQLEKRYKLIEKADKLMELYISIADDLFYNYVSKYSSLISQEIEESGIYYHYHIDSYDYSKGTDDFFASKEKIESLVDEYNKKKRKEKLEKLNDKKNR